MPASTALAIGGVATQGISAALSFSEASKQRDKMEAAQKAAAKSMEEAKNMLGVNAYEGLSVNKTPYELQREALLASGQQSIQAAQEADARNLSAIAGRVQMAQNEAQGQISTAMSKEMSDIDKAVAEEQSRLNTAKANLSLQENIGAQKAALDAEKAYNQYRTAGFESAIGAVGAGLNQFLPLFAKKSTGDGGVNANAVSGAVSNYFNVGGGSPNPFGTPMQPGLSHKLFGY